MALECKQKPVPHIKTQPAIILLGVLVHIRFYLSIGASKTFSAADTHMYDAKRPPLGDSICEMLLK